MQFFCLQAEERNSNTLEFKCSCVAFLQIIESQKTKIELRLDVRQDAGSARCVWLCFAPKVAFETNVGVMESVEVPMFWGPALDLGLDAFAGTSEVRCDDSRMRFGCLHN